MARDLLAFKLAAQHQLLPDRSTWSGSATPLVRQLYRYVQKKMNLRITGSTLFPQAHQSVIEGA